jgi:acetolactate synthase-1/2/3 large subunit
VHDPAVGPLWDEADLVIAVGTDFDGMMTQNWAMPAPPKLITVNVDAADAAKNYPPDVTLTGDAARVLDALLPHLPQRGDLAALTARLSALGDAVTASVRADEPLAADLLDTLRRVVPEDAPIVCDMCIPGYWIGGYHPVPAPRKLAYPMGWGTLGFGFPASVGSAIAMAEDGGRTVCVTGDGGFLFACGDLATVAQERAPLTVVLVDDGGYGMLRFDQVQGGLARRGVDLHTPDFAGLARSFGIPATAVKGFGAEFAGALRDSLAADGPNFVIVDAAMTPPPTTSPRWYRRKGGH